VPQIVDWGGPKRLGDLAGAAAGRRTSRDDPKLGPRGNRLHKGRLGRVEPDGD
jgi:hypothetical protein